MKPSHYKRLAVVLLFSMLIALTGACTPKSETAEMAEIAGSVLYRERIALPPNAIVTVSLEDTAKMDAKSELIGSTSFSPQGGPPFDFVIEYDPGKINDRGRYALRAKIQAGDKLLFTSTESIPAFEGEADTPVQIMVYQAPGKNDADTPLPSTASLTDTYWKLTEIDSEAATLGAGEKEVHMVLDSESNRARGFSGCNTFTGSYETSEDNLIFSQMASTMKACVTGMDQEKRFLLGLEKTTRYGITGETLELLGEGGESLLRFEAVYLR